MLPIRIILFLFLSLVCTSLFAVEFGVYGGVSLNHNERSNQTNYNLDSLDLFATQEVGKKTEAFIELVFEDTGSGGIVSDIERFWVSYAIHKNVKIGAGRFHTSMGFWNHNYHHGSFLQDTVTRPFFLDFEDGENAIMPVHSIGFKLNLNLPLKSGKFNLDFIAGNGNSLNSTDDILIFNQSPIHNIKTSYASRISFVQGTRFSIGASFLLNQFTAADTFGGYAPGDFIFRQNIAGLDFKYDHKKFYLLTEYFGISNKDEFTKNSESSTAWYLQLGFRLIDNFIFTLRHAELSNEITDTYYNIVNQGNDGDIDFQTLAIRYNINESNALKLEIQEADKVSLYTLQWAFLLF